MNIESDFDVLLKIAVLGDATVGKTNLVLRFTENTFSPNVAPTVGYDYKSKTITLTNSNKKAKLQIWDTAGQERFMALSKTVYQKVDGVMLVYDITRRPTFENILSWINRVKEFKSNFPIIIIGNKIDKEDERQVTYEEGKNFGDEHKLKFFETSALNGVNVEEAFINFSNEVLDNLKANTSLNNDHDSLSIEKYKNKKNKKCC